MPNESSKKLQVGFRIDPELYERFKKKIRDGNLDREGFVEEILRAWVEGRPVRDIGPSLTSRLESVASRLERLEELCKERHAKEGRAPREPTSGLEVIGSGAGIPESQSGGEPHAKGSPKAEGQPLEKPKRGGKGLH